MYVDFDVWRNGADNEEAHRVTAWLTRDHFYVTRLHNHPQLAPHLLPVVHRLGAELPCACPLMHQLIHVSKRAGVSINTNGTGRSTRGPLFSYLMRPQGHQSQQQIQDVLHTRALRWQPGVIRAGADATRDSARLLLRDLGCYRSVPYGLYPKEAVFGGDVAQKGRTIGEYRPIVVPLLLYMQVRRKFIYSPGRFPFLPERSRRSQEDNAWIYKGVRIQGTHNDRLTGNEVELTFVDT